jgi:hypothetical protein
MALITIAMAISIVKIWNAIQIPSAVALQRSHHAMTTPIAALTGAATKESVCSGCFLKRSKVIKNKGRLGSNLILPFCYSTSCMRALRSETTYICN